MKHFGHVEARHFHCLYPNEMHCRVSDRLTSASRPRQSMAKPEPHLG
jgi:hypothetical protein